MRFFFLLYFSRSGSTFLANALSQSASDALVMPELRFVEQLVNLGNARLSRMSSKELVQLLQTDARWDKIHVSDLEAVIRENKQLGVRGLVEAICNCYAQEQGFVRPPQTVVIKSGTALRTFAEIKKHFADAGVIHISRDPRGAIASLWQSPAAFRKASSMSALGPFCLGRRWLRYQRGVAKLARRSTRVITLTYEALCLQHDETMADLLEALQVAPRRGGPQIPLHESENEIHANVSKPPLARRCLAWQESLKPRQGLALEVATRDYLTELFFTSRASVAQKCVAVVGYRLWDVVDFLRRAGRFVVRFHNG